MVSGCPHSGKLTATLKYVYRTYEAIFVRLYARYTCLQVLTENFYEGFNSPEASDSAIALIYYIVAVFQIVVLLMLDDITAEAPGCQGLFGILAAPQGINCIKVSG